MTRQVLTEIAIPGLPLVHRGKVRETFDLGDRLFMVATDRISAYDAVIPTGIPDKGVVLTQLSRFWFERTVSIVPNHLITTAVPDLPELTLDLRSALAGRTMVVRRAQRIDIECVARGYLAGSAWAEYLNAGTVAGIPLPSGLVESDRLPEPLFTPAIKSDSGHDVNISADEMAELVGADLTERLRDITLAVYVAADAYARDRGVIIADTKMEFGVIDGTLTLIDELLTPDSSRFWDAAHYHPGQAQPSFDKQYVRDWLTASGWDREPPAPGLPPEVVEATAAKYREAYERITGQALLPGA